MSGSGESGGPARARIAAYAFLAAFVVLAATMIAEIIVAERAYSDSALKTHPPIAIAGGQVIETGSGVVGGSGTESDPYIIEGWTIQTSSDAGITLRDIDAHITIRHVSIASSGPGSSQPGIHLINASNVRVESCFVTGFSCGMQLSGGDVERSGRIVVSNCTFTNEAMDISISNSASCIITGCLFYYSDQPVRVDNSSGIELSHCEMLTARGPWMPMPPLHLENVSDSFVENNVFRVRNDLWGFVTDSSSFELLITDSRNVSFKKNSVQARLEIRRSSEIVLSSNHVSTGEGVLVEDCANTTIAANLLMPEPGWLSDARIVVVDSRDSSVSGNRLIRSGGISIGACRNMLVAENYVLEAGYSSYVKRVGLYAYSSSYLTVSRNSFVNCTAAGMYLYGLDHATIERNNVSGDKPLTYSDWLYVDYLETADVHIGGSNLSIRDNKIAYNTETSPTTAPGLVLHGCLDAIFERNSVSDALTVDGSANLTLRSNVFERDWNISVLSWAHPGTISFYQNNFLGRTAVTIFDMENLTSWNASYPEGGNYWSDYSGEDLMSGEGQNMTGPDGFGDTPQPVNSGAADGFPRMAPMAIDDRAPPCTIAFLNGSLGERMYYTSDVSVDLVSFDAISRISEILYSLDSGDWHSYTSGVIVSGEGAHELRFYAVDGNGNVEETRVIEMWIDSQAPFPVSPLQRRYDFRAETAEEEFIGAPFHDNTSGFGFALGAWQPAHQDMSIWPWAWESFTACDIILVSFAPGTGQMNITATDEAGNSVQYSTAIEASVSPFRAPFDLQGPYAYWLQVELLADVILFLCFLLALMVSIGLWPPRTKWTPREESERHYDDEVVDGYPKYVKRV